MEQVGSCDIGHNIGVSLRVDVLHGLIMPYHVQTLEHPIKHVQEEGNCVEYLFDPTPLQSTNEKNDSITTNLNR